MTNLIIAPIVIPALTAAFIILGLRGHLKTQRTVSIAATTLLLAVSIGLLYQAASGVPVVYKLGDWPVPYGIVLVLDRLSATMLVLNAVLGLGVVLYASAGSDRKGRLFHPLFQFQLLGINGAFLTGDIFNLFVYFEVMLIASYGLMVHGGGSARLKAGFQYVAINLVASTLFLIAIGLIYGVTGTLNMADLAVKVPQVAAADPGILKAGALLLFLVFATKAALVPLHWWLPATYASTSAPAAAIFMIMTKVGAYAILRVYGLIFGADAGALAMAAAPYVLPAAVVTVVLGTIGVVGTRTLKGIAAFAVVASMGTLLIALGLFNATGVAAALYYLVHSTLAGAALFLIAGMVAEGRGGMEDRLRPAMAMRAERMIAGLYMLAALGMVGLPPLSGFIGKVMILEAVRTSPGWPWIWGVILITSLLLIYGFARAGSTLFWASAPAPAERTDPRPKIMRPAGAIGLLLAVLMGWTLAGGPAAAWMQETAAQALDRNGYVAAVLGQRPGEPPGGY
ncbi:monovalent cation/H+ antiporter subunit D [Xanthobacter sp. TB0139]|uniref:monovalent cation/H+ antiporter subunit D n=1 Tax=Xanthobacter sp. TB0139 TaxID=3459178 RepID=UPI0040396AB4